MEAKTETIRLTNEAIELVRELRDTTILPEEMPDHIQNILTILSFLKANLLVEKK